MLAACALLLLYGAGSTQTGYLHQLFHPDEIATVHSAKEELDPCHQSIYHGSVKGCRHDFHMTKVPSCGLVHTISQSHLHFFFAQPSRVVILKAGPPVQSDQGRVLPLLETVFLRGPPSVKAFASLG